MSRIVPQAVTDSIRSFNDLCVTNYGIPCTLSVLKNPEIVDSKDVYTKPSDFTFEQFETLVFIEWSLNHKRLKFLGIFVEGETPLVAWFRNKIVDLNGIEQDVTIPVGSKFKIPLQFIPSSTDSDEFEIIDVVIKALHDSVALKLYKIAPLRHVS